MFSMITSIYRHPASRRKWLTIFSGAFITFALVAWYGFGLAGPWAPLMTTAAILAGYDIALRAWAALRLRHLSIELLVIVAATGAVFIDWIVRSISKCLASIGVTWASAQLRTE